MKKAFGDFQTPPSLAERATALVASIYGTPDIVVEPTCGVGAFILSAAKQWGKRAALRGFVINAEYVDIAKSSTASEGVDADIRRADFFTEDWRQIISGFGKEKILVLGNPPWVTNSALSGFESGNRPQRTNFQNMRGMDALTGKANFDIAEWMILKLMDALPSEGFLAMLCKTSTARKALRHVWNTRGGLAQTKLFRIDAAAEFGVAVDACLFATSIKPAETMSAEIYESLSLDVPFKTFGIEDGDLVSDMSLYHSWKHLDGGSVNYVWRSGIKHDMSSVMEIVGSNGKYTNGLGEELVIEDTFVYPLMKSSDLGNGRCLPRKSVIVPQDSVNQNTSFIKESAPLTWEYLERHSKLFEARKSSIYANKPPFSIFGIGEYSFAKWKVAVSGLYKNCRFCVIPPFDDKPVMLDDTCYFIPCKSENEAVLICNMLDSAPAKAFFESLIFSDSKRPITADILRRLSFSALARQLAVFEQYENLLYASVPMESQMLFCMED